MQPRSAAAACPLAPHPWPPPPPRCACRHQLSLYAHVSKVTWQFEAPARVAGTVCNPLRTFDYDPGTTPNFEIVNSLWDLMGTEDA